MRLHPGQQLVEGREADVADERRHDRLRVGVVRLGRFARDELSKARLGVPEDPALAPGADIAPAVQAADRSPARPVGRVGRGREVRKELRRDERLGVPRDPAPALRVEERVEARVRQTPVGVRVEQDAGKPLNRQARRGEDTIDASVTIGRPVREVFDFYRNFKNLPSFLGDVMAIEQTGPATSRWTIQGPLGIRANWTIGVTEERPNELIRYETAPLPGVRTSWEIHFAPGSGAGETDVREVMKAPLARLGRAALALIGKFPAEEVSANLRRLKELMETGRVTDTSYSVAGKFGRGVL